MTLLNMKNLESTVPSPILKIMVNYGWLRKWNKAMIHSNLSTVFQPFCVMKRETKLDSDQEKDLKIRDSLSSLLIFQHSINIIGLKLMPKEEKLSISPEF